MVESKDLALMADSLSKGETDKKQFNLPGTPEVVELVRRIRRKYLKAIVDDDDDRLDSLPSECQLLRAGLLMLDDAKPEEIARLINRAKRKRGPHSDGADSKQTEIDTRPRKRALHRTATGVS